MPVTISICQASMSIRPNLSTVSDTTHMIKDDTEANVLYLVRYVLFSCLALKHFRNMNFKVFTSKKTNYRALISPPQSRFVAPAN